ncbi:AIM24 family protein [Aureispira sp. CCB-E]|uniref:AIM24 family protein n=1 Tax=Aureispira sp. CCB-E TaxID=3051121 RepID=UPI002868851B|nr:AIM24 family protein [Aureispira sp. CCB-E]WMX15631.1 AIM24 family protein [Aureispira sp. CCB-E]
MDLQISPYPGSFLLAKMNPSEKIITEKGVLISCNGRYHQENKIEARGVKNWLATAFGKSLIYNMYTAQESVQFIFAPKNNAELFSLDINAQCPVLFDPQSHFARTTGLDIELAKQDWKSALNDGLKLRTKGKGNLILKGHGTILEQTINTQKPIYIDESALVAFEASLSLKTISKSIKETLTSGEGFLCQVTGSGKIWLQTRTAGESSGGSGMVSNLF